MDISKRSSREYSGVVASDLRGLHVPMNNILARVRLNDNNVEKNNLSINQSILNMRKKMVGKDGAELKDAFSFVRVDASEVREKLDDRLNFLRAEISNKKIRLREAKLRLRDLNKNKIKKNEDQVHFEIQKIQLTDARENISKISNELIDSSLEGVLVRDNIDHLSSFLESRGIASLPEKSSSIDRTDKFDYRMLQGTEFKREFNRRSEGKDWLKPSMGMVNPSRVKGLYDSTISNAISSTSERNIGTISRSQKIEFFEKALHDQKVERLSLESKVIEKIIENGKDKWGTEAEVDSAVRNISTISAFELVLERKIAKEKSFQMTELGNSTKDVGLNALSKGTENKLYRERSEEPQEGYFPAMPGTLASTVFNPKPEKQIIEKKQDSGIGFLERMAAFSEMVRNKSLDMMEDIKKAFGNIGSFTPVNEGVEAGIVGVENYMNRAPMTPREQAVRREKEDIEDTPRARRREIINSPIVKSEDSNLDIDSIKPSSEPKNPSKEISNPTYKGYVHSGPGF